MIECANATELNSEKANLRLFSLSLRKSSLVLCSLGASILSWKQGDGTDIVLGYKDAATMSHAGNPVYFSGIVGRVANRIAKGKLSFHGKTFHLEINDPPNHLHGGGAAGGFSHKEWDAEIIDMNGGTAVQFSLLSSDGDQGFPGSVQVTATYSLRPSLSSSGVTLRLDMNAKLVGDKPTPINLAQHSYFNLSGQTDPHGILDHSLKIESDAYTPVDETSIPTREVRSLDKDLVMDWRVERKVREALQSYGIETVGLSKEVVTEDMDQRKQTTSPYGFDHNYVVRQQPGTSIPQVASLVHNTQRLTVYSDAPGCQLYTSNYLSPESENYSVCKATYKPWSGLCLETQYFPDSIYDSSEPVDDFGKGKCCILSPQNPDYKHTVEYCLESVTSEIAGSDTNGRKYSSREEMWKAQDLSSWYKRAKDWYEGNCQCTVDGVLGGIGWISDIDLNGSRGFLNSIALPKAENTSIACEVGAGIGRVTKGLLLDFCDRCDLVESSERLLFAAPEYIGNDSYKCRFFASELQEWEPPANKYTIVWIQWVLCYLTDDDIVKFLRRCRDSLVDGGVIVMKENTCVDQSFVVDVDDASVTRSVPYWLDLIFKAGLKVSHHTSQEDFPDDIFPVPLLALQRA